MRIRRLTAAILAICMMAVMLPSTAFAADFFFNDSAVEGNTISIDRSINDPATWPERLRYNFQPAKVEIAEKNGISFDVTLTRERMEIVPYRTDGQELSPSDIGTLTTGMKITLSDGSVVDRYEVKLTLDNRISPQLTILDAVGKEVPSSKLVAGETYKLKLTMVDKSGISSAADWTGSIWELSNETPQGVVTLGTATGSYPTYYNTMTFSEDGSVKLNAGFTRANGGVTGMGDTIATMGNQSDASGFYLVWSDRYGMEVDETLRLYPNSTVSHSWSINRTWNQMNGRDFVSDKKPVSVRATNPNNFDFELHNIEKKADGRYYGGLSYRVKKDAAGKTEWSKADVGQSYQSDAIVTFLDGSSVKYSFRGTASELPMVSRDVKSGRVKPGTYSQKYTISDKADVLDDNTKAIATWNVITGKEKVALGVSSISKPTTGTVTKMENTVTFSDNVRGDVRMEVNFANDPLINRPANSGGGTDPNKNIGGDIRFTYIVEAPSQPMSAEKVAEVSRVESGKLVVDVPSINTLPIAALDAIRTAAIDGDCQRVELKVHDRVTIGLGASSLQMDDAANVQFKQAMENNGNTFDTMVIQSAPDAAVESGLNTDLGFWMDFAHKGALPVDTVMTVDVEDTFEGYDNLALWYFNEKTGELERADDIEVDFDGNTCVFPLEHCSAWVLYPDVAGYNPNPEGAETEHTSSSSSGGGKPAVIYPTVAQGLTVLGKITTLDAASLPLGVTLAKTFAGKDIAALQVSLNESGAIDIASMLALGKLPATVGFLLKQGGGAAEILLPGGFGAITEMGRFAYPLRYEAMAPNSAAMLAAVKGEATVSETCKLGGELTLPVVATVQLTTKISNGSTVRVYRYSPTTETFVLLATTKVEGGKVRFASKNMGQILVTTGQL